MRINIVSTYTTDLMRPYLESLLVKFTKVNIHIFYNQVYEQLLFPGSEFNINNEGLNVLIIRLSDLIQCKLNFSRKDKSKIDELICSFNGYKKKQKVSTLIIFTPSHVDHDHDANIFLSIEKNIQAEFNSTKNVIVLNSHEVLEHVNTKDVCNPYTDRYGHVPYIVAFYEELSFVIARYYSLLNRKPNKVIVLDCDGTLWDGVNAILNFKLKDMTVSCSFGFREKFKLQQEMACPWKTLSLRYIA